MNKKKILEKVKENLRSQISKNEEKTLVLVFEAARQVIREDYGKYIKEQIDKDLIDLKLVKPKKKLFERE